MLNRTAAASLLVLATVAPPALGTDPPVVQWQRTFRVGVFAECFDVVQTADGGYLLVGRAKPVRGRSRFAVLMRLSAVGESLWCRTYTDGDSNHNRDEFCAVAPAQEGGYTLAGTAGSVDEGESDGWVVRADSAGDVVWQRSLALPGDLSLFGIGVLPGGHSYTVVGRTYGSTSHSTMAYVARLDSAGQLLWQHVLSIEALQPEMAMCVLSDGSTVAFGFDGRLRQAARLDSLGGTVWTRTFADSTLGPARGACAVGTDIVVAGIAGDTADHRFVASLVRLDSDGNTVWERRFGRSVFDDAKSVSPTSGGGFTVAGWSSPPTINKPQGFAMGVNSNGIQQWVEYVGEVGQQTEIERVRATSDGGSVVAGCAGLGPGEGIGARLLIVKFGPPTRR